MRLAAGAKAGIPPRWQPSYFTVLAFAVWFVVTWNNTVRVHAPLALAAEGALFILSIYLLRVPEISLLGQGYLLVAQGIWIYDAFAGHGFAARLEPGSDDRSHHWPRLLVAKANGAEPAGADPTPTRKRCSKLSVVGKNLVLLAGMHIAVVLAGGWDLAGNVQLGASGIYLPMGLGALMLADALLAHRHSASASQPRAAAAARLFHRAGAGGLAGRHLARHRPRALPAGAGGGSAAADLLLLPPARAGNSLARPGLHRPGAGGLGWVFRSWSRAELPPWWNPVLLIVITLVLSHWWQRQKFPELRAQFGLFCQGLYALAIVGVLYSWLAPKTDCRPGWPSRACWRWASRPMESSRGRGCWPPAAKSSCW